MTILRLLLRQALILLLLAFSVVLVVSERVLQTDYFHRAEATLKESLVEQEEDVVATETCAESLMTKFRTTDDDDTSPQVFLQFDVHRNGEPDPCGSVELDLQAFQEALATMDGFSCNQGMTKYQVESFLTRFFASSLEGCSSTSDERPGFLSFCDMGQDKTPILLDHDQLLRVMPEGSLPCRFFTREGIRIASLEQLAELGKSAQQACVSSDESTCDAKKTLHLYAVPAGRVFMFAPSYVGEVFELSHITTSLGLPVSLKVLSVEPRVFDIYNFFSRDEAHDLVKRALAETADSHRIKRSTTGTKEYAVYSKRTSENGFDTHGETAMTVKERCMHVLGYDGEFKDWEGHTDGLQILRYNKTTAYIPHMDYMTDRSGTEKFDYDSAARGGNRYATILLYMSDLSHKQDGGETVFSKAWPAHEAEEDHMPLEQAIQDLRESGDASFLEPDSWEEEMVATCRTKLAVRPYAGRAVLFYSQHPDGRPDPFSRHGGCPVLKGEKWAANLWVWNTPREGFVGSPVKSEFDEDDDEAAAVVETPTPAQQIKVTFVNSGKDPDFQHAELFWDKKQSWGKIGHGDPPLVAYTYEGHKWDIKVNGEFVKTWVIGPGEEQTLTI